MSDPTPYGQPRMPGLGRCGMGARASSIICPRHPTLISRAAIVDPDPTPTGVRPTVP